MNITVIDQEHCKKQLQLQIPGEDVRLETDKVAGDLARKVRVPGFRPGHVPKSVIKTKFRKELRDEVASSLLPQALGDAIREKDLKVIGKPALSELRYGDDESINVTFTIEVVPEFDLAEYKNIALAKRVYTVTDEEVDRAIERMRERHAELVPVEDRPAQTGDQVTATIKGRLAPRPAGEEVAAGEATGAGDQPEAAAAGQGKSGGDAGEEVEQRELQVELGGEGVMKEFTQALTGTKAGDVVTFTVDYPEDYSTKRYAGRRASYTAEVTAVRAKELPDLDDEFAKTINHELSGLAALRADVRARTEHEAEHRSQSELEVAAMEQLVARNRFEVPSAVLEKQIETRFERMIRQLAEQGLDPRTLKIDWESVRESQRKQAERDLRGSFILSRIVEREKIQATEQDLDREIEVMATASGKPADVLKARLTKENALDTIKEQIEHRKALELVIASADIKVEEVQGYGSGEDGGEGKQAEEGTVKLE